MVQIIFPPRPKGKMLHTELPFYESTGKWVAQRKFRGSRAVIHISADRKITLGNRHGKSFSKFVLDKNHKDELLSLNLETGKEYWLDGELMNKDVNATNEIILFDVLQAGRYLFGRPNQIERLAILADICRNPTKYCRLTQELNIPTGFAFEVTPRIWMAETFTGNFKARFDESLPIQRLEGLVLRKKESSLDNFGATEYETGNIIRCRKPFASETPKDQRSGGYLF